MRTSLKLVTAALAAFFLGAKAMASMPDLQVTAMSFAPAPGTPVPPCSAAGIPVYLKVTVANTGAIQTVSSCQLSVTGTGGSGSVNIPTIAMGGQVDLWVFGISSPGTYYAQADASGQIAELDEGNNILQANVAAPTPLPTCVPGATDTPTPQPPNPTATNTITAPNPTVTPLPGSGPDLEVVSMSITLSPVPGCVSPNFGPLGILVTVRNNGSVASPGTGLTVNGGVFNLSAIVGGGQASVWSPNYNAAGSYTAVVDPTGAVLESDETNNSLTLNLPIPTPPPACTPGPSPTATAIPLPDTAPCSGKVKVYPNPVRQVANFSWAMPKAGKATVTVRSTSGKLVAEKSAYFPASAVPGTAPGSGQALLSLNLSSLRRGVYLYSLSLEFDGLTVPRWGCGQLVKR